MNLFNKILPSYNLLLITLSFLQWITFINHIFFFNLPRNSNFFYSNNRLQYSSKSLLSLSKIFSILILNLFLQISKIQQRATFHTRKRPSKNDSRRPFIPLSATFLNSPLHSFRSHVSIVRNLIDKRVLSNGLTCRNVSIHVEGPRNVSIHALRVLVLLSMAGRSIWRLRKPHFSTALLEETLDEGKFQVEISPPSLSRDGNGVGGGILLAAVARAKVVPLSSRMPLKYIFLSVLFRCIAFHDYTFAMYTSHPIPSNRFHIIWHVSSFLLVHAIGCKKN